MGDARVRRLARRAFGLSRRQRVVVDVESARETEAPREDERRDERGRAIAGVLQAVRENRMRVGEVPRVLVDAVARRDTARSSSSCAKAAFRAPWRTLDGSAGPVPRARRTHRYRRRVPPGRSRQPASYRASRGGWKDGVRRAHWCPAPACQSARMRWLRSAGSDQAGEDESKAPRCHVSFLGQYPTDCAKH